mgnify:CR=1 FL=1
MIKIMRCKYCSFELMPEDFEKKEANWKCSCGTSKSDFKESEDFLDEALNILHIYKEGTVAPDIMEHSCSCADPEQ